MKDFAHLYRPKSGGTPPGRGRTGDGNGPVMLCLSSGRSQRHGKVIGRQGRIAREIRTLMRSVAQRQGKKVSAEIMD